jgi:hypothetical protein
LTQAKLIDKEILVLEVQVNIEKLLSDIGEQRGSLSFFFGAAKHHTKLRLELPIISLKLFFRELC